MFKKLIQKHNKEIIYSSRNPHYESDTIFAHYFRRYWPYQKRVSFSHYMQDLVLEAHSTALPKTCTQLIHTKFPDIVNKKYHFTFNFYIYEMLFGTVIKSKDNVPCSLFIKHPRIAFRIIQGNPRVIRHIVADLQQSNHKTEDMVRYARNIKTSDDIKIPGLNPHDYQYKATVAGNTLAKMKLDAAFHGANAIIGSKIRIINGQEYYLGTAIYDKNLNKQPA